MKKFWRWLLSPAVAGFIGIVGLVLAVYTAFFYERKPELAVSVDALSKVFDLYRPVGGLEVSYAGENLRSSKKNLWVLTATVKNVGNAEVRKVDYDDKSPLGLEIGGAVIAERPTLKTTVNYLGENLAVSFTGNQIVFSPVILEPGDAFEITVLLLGSESAKPTVTPVGKVAGIKTISLTTPETPTPNRSIWRQSVEATSPWVHLIRGPIYMFGTLLSLILVGVAIAALMSPISKIQERRKVAQRQAQLREYRQHEELRKESRYLIDQYVASGEAGLARVARYLRIYARRESLIQ